ncbi:MAG TPA: hypothetical protein VF887_08290 [Gemmatimonadaceae bacterium]
MSAQKMLKYLVTFIGAYHLVIGVGLMFSPAFQRFAVHAYGASFDWNVRDVYYIRIIGSFVVVLGSMALAASRDPLRYWPFVMCYVEFFVLRDISRHLFSHELYEGFAVTPWMNVLTSVVFAAQALALVALLWLARREAA